MYEELEQTDKKPSSQTTECIWRTVCVLDEHNIESTVEQEMLCENITDGNQISRHHKTDGLFIMDYRFVCASDALMKIAIKQECILMEFLLHGGTDKKEDNVGRHNLYYIDEGDRIYELHENTVVDYFCIFMSKEFYFNLMGRHNSQIHDNFVQDIRNGVVTQLTENSLPMNYEMGSIISKVRNCSRTGCLHRFCLEIKLQELLLQQFEQFQDMVTHITPKQMLNDSDAQKIKTAKVILEESYNTPPTIQQLARMVGVNEYKLKKSFKDLFGSTIHEYVTHYRMQKANKMIKEQNLQVKEIAVELGYKNPSHFSAAFKKYFGFLPTEMVE